MVRHVWLAFVFCSACGAHSAAATSASTAPTATISKPAETKRAKPPDARELSGQANFGDLVRLAQALDSGNDAHSESGCLLRGTEPLHFEADLSLSVRPLPPVSENASEVMEDRSGVILVLSPWGTSRSSGTSDGSGSRASQPAQPDAVLLPFTTTSPSAVKLPTVALFATAQGVYLRGAKALLPTVPTTALSPDQAGAWLARITDPVAVYVTAERTLELRRLMELLKLIPNQHEVALAVALPKGTRLPAPAADNGDGKCAHGLPDPAPNAVEGSLDPAAVRGALTPLRDAALSCAISTGGKALLGGKLVLALRIGQDGHAREACFVSDTISEPLLRRCLLAHVRDLALPAPSPAGFVDVHLPLQLELAGPKPQRASCN